MLIETYLTGFFTCMYYGKFLCWLIISFITSILVFVATVLPSYYFRKKKKEFNWLIRLVLVEAYLILAWVFFLITAGVSLHAFSVPILYGLAIFFLVVTPLTKLYQKIMKDYPMLPWHFTQYLTCFLATLIFWAVMVFFFNLFDVVSLWKP